MPGVSSPRSRPFAIADPDPAEGLIATLPTLQRLALSYAPAAAHGAWLGLLALDTRLAGIVRGSREPMLAQLRLAWWREQLTRAPGEVPRGEPLLAVLAAWGPRRKSLAALVDGWEAFAAAADMAAGIAALAAARGAAFRALGELGPDPCRAAAAARLADPAERTLAAGMLAAHEWRPAALPRAMRPLTVLHGLAQRAARRRTPIDALPPAALAAAMRIGLLGR